MRRDRLVVIGGDAAGMSAAAQARDLSYAPPFSPTNDPVPVAARVASRVEQG